MWSICVTSAEFPSGREKRSEKSYPEVAAFTPISPVFCFGALAFTSEA